MAYERKWENWGGARENAGRPRKYSGEEERAPHSVYCSMYEMEMLRRCLKQYREYEALREKAGTEIGSTEYKQAKEKENYNFFDFDQIPYYKLFPDEEE